MAPRDLLLIPLLLACACGPRLVERPEGKAPPPATPLPIAPTSAPAAPPAGPSPLTGPAPSAAWFALGDSAPPGWPTRTPDPGTVAPSVGLLGDEPVAIAGEHGELFVAWGSDEGLVRVRKLEGERFQDLPPIPAQNVPTLVAPVLVRGKDGRPIVAFLEGDHARVFSWNGERFQDLSPRTPPPARRFEGMTGGAPVACPAVVRPMARPGFAVDTNGHPVLAWAEPAGRVMRLVVLRHDGRSWQTLSAPGVAPVDVCAPHSLAVRLVLDGQGQPAAMLRAEGHLRIFRGRGARLEELPRIRYDDSAFPTYAPAFTTDEGGRPWLAFAERVQEGGRRISVRRLEKSGWEAVPMPRAAESTEPVALSGGKAPSISLLQPSAAGTRLRVLQWRDGHAEERTGGPEGALVRGLWPTGRPAVVSSPDGGPLAVVFREATSIQVRRWIDGAFRAGGPEAQKSPARLGEGPALDAAPAVAMRGGTVAVAFLSAGGIAVRHHSKGAWTSLPDAAPANLSPSSPPLLALDTNGRPVLAWSTHAGTTIAVRRFEGDAFRDLGVARPNLAPDGAPAHAPVLAGLLVDSTDAPVLGWHDKYHSFFQILRWDGAAWKSVLEDRGQVVATLPAMALDAAGRLVVATTYWDAGKMFLRLRRQTKGSFEELPRWSAPLKDLPPRLWVAAGAEPVVGFRLHAAEPWVLRAKGASFEVLSVPGLDGMLQPFGLGALVLDDVGAPIVAYANDRTGEIEALRHFNGWTSLAGAHTVSASDAPSVDPAMAISGDTVCVAWAEPAGGASNVALRCHRRGGAPIK